MKLFYLFAERKHELAQALMIHLEITLIAIFIAILISVPLGIWLSKHPRYSGGVIGVASIIQTVPSLALLGFMIPLFGIGIFPALVALVLYAILPIIRNTYIGISEINPANVEAGIGMGMTRWQLLRMVQIPLALPMIIGGIRTATVWTVGVATLGALIGAGGLGEFIFRGIATANSELILLGAIPAALLAIFFDLGLALVEKTKPTEGIQKKKWLKYLWLIPILFLAFAISQNMGEKKELTIGGKNYSEQDILVEIIKQTIEGNSDITVNTKPFLGGTSVVASAMDRGDLDMYVEYTGTALLHILKLPIETDPDKAYQIVKTEAKKQKNLIWLSPLGFNNTYTLTMKRDKADQLNINTISDLAPHSNNLSFGCESEFLERPDGYPGIQKAYHLKFNKVSPMDTGLMYGAARDGQVDVIDAFATDGRIPTFNLKILKDDKQFFPPYYAAPVIRADTLAKYPELEGILNKLAGQLSDDEMAALNAQVDLEKKSPKDVAQKWLKGKGIIK